MHMKLFQLFYQSRLAIFGDHGQPCHQHSCSLQSCPDTSQSQGKRFQCKMVIAQLSCVSMQGAGLMAYHVYRAALQGLRQLVLLNMIDSMHAVAKALRSVLVTRSA